MTSPAMALVAAVASSATLVGALRTSDPAAMVDRVASLGRTIDLFDGAQVRAAIGPVEGLPARRSTQSAFAGYTLPAGEVVFNPDRGTEIFLGISPSACVPTATVRARLRAPEFGQASDRTTVALYENVPYRDRPGTAFTFTENYLGCVTTFGIRQWKPGT